MGKRMITGALLVGLTLILFGPTAPQDTPTERAFPTGLKTMSDTQLREFLSTHRRVTSVHLNPLGFERVNAVRTDKGKPLLDRLILRPIGREIVSSVPRAGVTVQAVLPEPEILGDLPVVTDNSKLKYFPPIRNQSPLGSCASFSTTYVQLSYMAALQRDLDIRDPLDNTNKYSPKWSYNMVNDGEDSGSFFSDNYDLLERSGAATWAEFPYDSNFKAWCLSPTAWRNALSVRTEPVQYLRPVSSEDGLELARQLLVNGYVLVFGTYISSWQETTIPNDPTTTADDTEVGKAIGFWLNGTEGGHAMTIVGYNDAIWTDINGNGYVDTGEKGAFRVANSWGPAWKDAGFIWLAYDALRSTSAVPGGPSAGRVAALQNDMVYVLTIKSGYAPLMVAELTVNHAKRDQMRLSLGRSAVTSIVPTTVWTPGAFQYQGGAYAFDGTTTAVDGTFVLDFTDILLEGAGALRYHLGMRDNASGDPGTIKAFKVIDLTTSPPTEVVSSTVPLTADNNQQVYAYLDYTYTGPAYNNPPQLSYGHVVPTWGSTTDTFTFYVYYEDQDGDVPTVKDIVLDGTARPMSYAFGNSASDGWYAYQTTLAAGAHEFFFSFDDGRGKTTRHPFMATISGPDVYELRLDTLSPASVMAGSAGFVLTAGGVNFLDGAVVRWDGADRPTQVVSSTELRADIGASDVAAGREVAVTVRNPGGAVSNAVTFAVTNPVPTLTSISPLRANGGGAAFTLTVGGSGFVNGSAVRWNGASRTTTYVSATELRASIPASDLAAGGEFDVSVANPPPGGGSSSGLTFTVSSFALEASPSSTEVTAGQSAVYTVQVAPEHGPFDAAVAFSCSGLPRNATATFSPASVTPGGAAAQATLTVATKARQSASIGGSVAAGGSLFPAASGLALLVGALVLPLARREPRTKRRRARLLSLAGVVLSAALLFSSCGAGGGDGGQQNTGTPAGSYTIQVQAASGSMTAQKTVTLVVK